MRKIFTLLLLLIPLWMQAQDGYTWNDETKTLTIKTAKPNGDTYKTTAETLIIEGTYTTIPGSAFKQYSALKKVIINDGVTSIQSSAFSGCTSLKAITIPDGVTSIEGRVFENCSSLESVTMGDGVTSIKSYAFSGCTSLKEITIPDNVTRIESRAFENCSSLESVTIGDGVTIIQGYVFSGCTSLKAITIPDGVTSIESKTFENCTSLESVTMGDGVTSIGSYAFSGCTSLKEITIPNSVTSIGSRTFENCSSLESVTMGDGVTSIGGSAFNGCTSLKAITIPDGVTSIGGYTFSGCTSLEEITIPNNVTSIGSYVFSGCTSLKEITIPGSVTSIGHYAFNNCTALTNIVYEGITKPMIGDYAFSGISSEATVTVTADYEDDSFGDFSGDKLKKELYAISITPLTNGTLTATVDGKPAKYAKKDATITLTATPDEWYLFEEFTVTDAQDNPVAVTGNTFTMPASNVTVSASFKKQSYTLTINQPEGGSISAKVGDTEVTSNSQEVEFEKTVTLTATASDGYEFSGWNITDGNGKEVEIENNAFTMPASNVTVSATFSKIPTPEPEPEEPEEPVIPDYPDYYNIYVEECEGVTVLTSTNVVREGNSMTFTVEVAEGYTAEDMVVKVKRSLFGYTDVIEPNEEGKYEVRNIYTEIYITIEGVTEEETPTGIEGVESTAVYTQEGAIYVRTPQRATVSIVSLTGAIVKKAEQTGTQRYDLPRGIYIVDVAGQRYKVRN